MAKNTCIIVGLGNKGNDYADTRHNVGFLVLDELARRWRLSINQQKWNSLFSRSKLFGQTLLLLKPMTFMNLSGKGVVEFVRFYKVDPNDIMVVHDDLDMAPGRVKLVKGGGAGGHNGIKSLVQSLGTNDFFRLKIGIGRPGQGEVHRDFPVEKYVLSGFTPQELDILASRYEPIEQGTRFFFEDGPARAMSLLNSLK